MICLAAASCSSVPTWSLQGTVDNLIGDIDSLLGGSSLPGKHLAAIRDVHEAKSWRFLPDAEDPLETTRNAVRALATCDYASWDEAAVVVDILSSMADEHSSSLARAEALDTLARIGAWTIAAAVPPTQQVTDAEMIEGLKTLKAAVDKTDTDAAFNFQVETAVSMLASYPFDRVDLPPGGSDNRAAARAWTTQLRTARGALRSINSRSLEGFRGDPAVKDALDRAHVGLSATVIRLTLTKAALGDPTDTTRITAVRHLAVLAPAGSADAVKRVALHDAQASVRREAAKALASYPPAVAVPALVEALGDEMPEVRGGAAWSLETLSGESFGDDRAAWVRWWQARASAAKSP
jgi:hypothetical protein